MREINLKECASIAGGCSDPNSETCEKRKKAKQDIEDAIDSTKDAAKHEAGNAADKVNKEVDKANKKIHDKLDD